MSIFFKNTHLRLDFTVSQSLSKPYVSGLERGNINASVFALARIAEALKISATELMSRVEREIKKGPRKPEKDTGRPKK